MILDRNWKSFFNGIKGYNKNPKKYLGRPKIPKYLNKDGRSALSLDNNKIHIKDGYIYFSLSPLKPLNNCFRTKITGRLIQCRFIPHGDNYTMEMIYEIDVPETNSEVSKVASIDIGIENFVTMVNNIGERPIIIKGGILKSINQYYNKEKAKLQSNLPQGRHWSKKLETLTQKRNRKIDNFMHLCSKRIIQYCISNNIDTLIVGKNKNWKQSTDMGKKNNQNFVQIPMDKFIKMIEYKCENVGIRFITNEESYTSKASFLDLDNFNQDVFSGTRIKRGLYQSSNGTIINADVNGAFNIMRKAIPKIFMDGIEGVGLHPLLFKVC